MKKEIVKKSIKNFLDAEFPERDWTFNVNDDGSIVIVIPPKKH
jgi:hypothetical protein